MYVLMADYFFSHNALSESCIADIYSYMARAKKRQGLTGNRVNLKHKNRYDIYVSSEYVLSCIDKEIFTNYSASVFHNLNKKLVYREPYKVGVYEGEDSSFYNIHTDDARETKYRSISMVLALTPPDQYEGGYLEFPDLNLSFKLEFNTAIFFKSSLRHKVTNVTSGMRNVLISFFFDEEGGKLKTELKSPIDSRTLNYYEPVLKRSEPKSKFDVDYNDNSPHEWSDDDSHWFVDNSSDVLLISFAGFGASGSKPTFIFHNFLKDFDDIDQLFVRDLSCRWYLEKIRLINENNQRCDVVGIQNIQKWLFKLTNKKNYKRIIAIGCSSGGYAAILYSSLLNFDKCIAFSPQTIINKEGREEIDDTRYPKTSQYIQRLLNHTENSMFMDLKNISLIDTDIHYGACSEGGVDARHAERMECNHFPHNSNQHMIALELRNSGMLKIILSNALQKLKESIKKDEEKLNKMYSSSRVDTRSINNHSSEPDFDYNEYDEFEGNYIERNPSKPCIPQNALGSKPRFSKEEPKVEAPKVDTSFCRKEHKSQNNLGPSLPAKQSGGSKNSLGPSPPAKQSGGTRPIQPSESISTFNKNSKKSQQGIRTSTFKGNKKSSSLG